MAKENINNKKEEVVGEIVANAVDVALGTIDAAGVVIDTAITTVSHIG